MPKVNLSWTDPATRADGSSLAPTDIAFVRLSRSTDNGNTYEDVGHAAAGQQSFVDDVSGLGAGTFLYKATVEDTQTPALDSVDSAVVSVSVAPPELAPPAPVTGLAASLAE